MDTVNRTQATPEPIRPFTPDEQADQLGYRLDLLLESAQGLAYVTMRAQQGYLAECNTGPKCDLCGELDLLRRMADDYATRLDELRKMLAAFA
jgi:hypothetical protein